MVVMMILDDYQPKDGRRFRPIALRMPNSGTLFHRDEHDVAHANDTAEQRKQAYYPQ